MLVSVIVKALNEQPRIAACLEAALAALQGLDAELILVDSMSTDQTVEIARRYPVRIVQFDHPEHRGCGAAVELGWRYSCGQYIYVLDADMLLQAGFLQEAMAYMAVHPGVAAVGGKLIDTRVNTVADRQRARMAVALVGSCEVGELGGGGLYRRAAVMQAGYMGHRSLQAYEEAELGARLRSMGWTLVRLPQTAVLHEGHEETTRQMLSRLWANGRAKSAATFLHSALGQPWFGLVLRKLAHILVIPLLHALAFLLAMAIELQISTTAAIGLWVGIWFMVLLALAVTKRSLRLALWHLFLWHYWAVGTLVGFGRRAADPMAPIPAHEITDAAFSNENPNATRVDDHA